ncbi:MAG: DUF4197 domain-containing protein [Bacteroidales bacterium]
MKTRYIISGIAVVVLAGCAQLANVMQTTTSLPLSEDEVVRGLKEALSTGASNSAERLSAENGYYGDAAIKILLPDEARPIVDNISKIPGGQQLVEDVVLRINRAAEDAAKEVAPIFVGSITSMSIKDGFNILRGPDNAATTYLKTTTWDQLYGLYKPKIQNSTGKKIIGNVSTKDSWVALTAKWNGVANSVAGRLAGFKPVNTDLDDFLTRKALDGMFSKVAVEELKIRKDVSARVSPLLKRVFGSLDT